MRWKTQERYIRENLCRELGIPAVGQVFFVHRGDSSTRSYQEWFETDMDVPAELMFHGNSGIKAAYDACQNYRNDVVLVSPGWYSITSFEWAKTHTHIMAMQQAQPFETWGTGATVIYQSSTSAAHTIKVSGAFNKFKNFAIHAYGSNTAVKSALRLAGPSNTFEGMNILNAGAAVQAAVDCGSLWIDAASGDSGHNCIFNNCGIGDTGGTARTAAGGGVILFGQNGAGTTGGAIKFKDCWIMSRSETAACTLADFHSPWDRLVLFDNCMFYNHSVNHANTLTNCFNQTGLGTYMVALHNCGLLGIDDWQGVDAGYFFCTTGAGSASGGIGVQAT